MHFCFCAVPFDFASVSVSALANGYVQKRTVCARLAIWQIFYLLLIEKVIFNRPIIFHFKFCISFCGSEEVQYF